ncbi:MAG: circularly permuted type 2 ATP-grasp protein, partial [Hyphomonas sp.]|nr:circularly permuted type 2 ATP-grasp protein [Hyphomonas sp.]
MGEAPEFFDEMEGFGGGVRAPYAGYSGWLKDMSRKDLLKKSNDAHEFFRRTGITFNVYGQAEADERLIPFDLIPRIIAAQEWAQLVRGIEQRVKAINAFLHDIYHRQEIIRAGRVPERLIRENEAFQPKMIGFDPPGGIYTHIVGVDLVRTGANEFFVLEDNARTPSGVSYMLENRETMLKMFPELFSHIRVEPVQQYPTMLRRSLERSAPPGCDGRPTVAVLTPGIHNSAYFEHAFLADQMGVELVEGHDLRVSNGRIAMRTTRGFEPVDVIYRRIDDDFLDPLNFRPDSMLGVAGILDIYRSGGITIANAPGTGIADDKAIYSFMPEIVEFYTGEKPLLPNVETWRCADPESL